MTGNTLRFVCVCAIEHLNHNPIILVVEANYLLNWANTRVLGPLKQLHAPKSIAALQKLVRSTSKVRPIGSKLTYEGLTCLDDQVSDAILLDLTQFQGLVDIDVTAQRATFWAGTTIDSISLILKKYKQYIDCSPGVIGVQTIAGAIGTGTHGQGLGQSFVCDIVTQMEIMLADGSIVVLNEENMELLDAFRIHLGVLGIVLKVTIKTQPLRYFSR
jgi:FAD/FMN-containing dehydrogenase